MANLSAVDNETTSSCSRLTREGRKITYRMTVIQQPERARACGQGQKSSTDRRPVDPPPIVDLRIFEGDGEDMTDITFTFRANFFLFATLENARLIAQGRMPQASTNRPVLTGTPVAGMSYLDRPSPAGYFIFPDLSVRYEGKYRLSFSLFEELKDAKDEDGVEQPPEPHSDAGTGAHVNSRCVVKSAPFIVFSAKKFPGLAESTALSRMVADQGCRVRIRRDVRMRRRDSRKDWDDYEDQTAMGRVTREATPDTHAAPPAVSPEQQQQPQQPAMEPVQRPRSASSFSTSSLPVPQRRQPAQDVSRQYQQSHQTPQTPQHIPPQQQMLPQPPQHTYPPQASYEYGQYPHHAPEHQYLQHQQMSQVPQQVPQFQPPPYGYPQGMMPPPPGYVYVPQPMQPPALPMQQPVMYEQHMPHLRHDSMFVPPPPPNYHSDHIAQPQYNTQQSQFAAPLGPQDGYGRQTNTMPQANQQPMPTMPGLNTGSKALPPLNVMEASHTKLESCTPSSVLPPFPSHYACYQDYGPPPPPPHYLSHSNPLASKRSYGTVFDTHSIDQPLRGGARPDTSHKDYHPYAYDDSEDDPDTEVIQMEYRRADGTQISRRWPPL